MAYDIARIRRVMKQIEAEPETFYMGTYVRRDECGTTCCLAGHTVLDEGLRPYWQVTDAGEVYATRIADGRQIHGVAAELLGLTNLEADQIFYSTGVRTPAELWRVIEDATDGKVTEHDRV